MKSSLRSTLFDVACCKCFSSCNCSSKRRVPFEMIYFLEDQRSGRYLTLQNLSNDSTHDLNDSESISNENDSEDILLSSQMSNVTVSNSEPISQPKSGCSQSSSVYVPELSVRESIIARRAASNAQMRYRLPNTAAVCERFDIPSTTAAAIINSALDGMNMRTSANTIDGNEIK